MSEAALKSKFEKDILSMVEALIKPCKESPARVWEGEDDCYAATVGAYVKQSRDLKFNILDQFDQLITVKDAARREAFLIWLDHSRLYYRAVLKEMVSTSTGYEFSGSHPEI